MAETQRLSAQYIHFNVLCDFLDGLFGQKHYSVTEAWGEYIAIVPRKITDSELKSITRKYNSGSHLHKPPDEVRGKNAVLGERYNTPEHSEAPKNSITDGDDAAIANNNTQTGFVDQNAAGNVLSGSDNDNSKITADAILGEQTYGPENSTIDDGSVITNDDDSLFSNDSISSASSIFSLPQQALNQGQEAIAKILTSVAVSRIMVLVVEKLDSYVVDRRMSRVLRDFSNDIQELANEKVQKDSLQLLRNRATCTQIAAKIREISISSTDRPNNLLKVPPPPPPQLAQILAEYPEEDSPQRGVKKVDAWLQDRQPGTAREDSGPGNEFESTSSFREKHFPPPHDEQQKEQYSGSEDSADEDEAAEIPQSAIQAFYTAAQFYQSDRVQDLFLEAVRRKFIHSRKREESTPNDNALGELENPAQDDNILERCERTMPDGSAPGEREGNAPDDSALKDYGDTVSNDIALEEPQETKQDDNAIENCDETAPDEIVLGEREFEGIAHDNSLRVQEPKSADMVSSLPIKSGSNLWPERFADGKSDITFESIPCVWSFSNQVKSWIEDKTLTTIIWWPLAPRRRPLQPNCVQVTWTCRCGKKLSSIISIDRMHQYQQWLSGNGNNAPAVVPGNSQSVASQMNAQGVSSICTAGGTSGSSSKSKPSKNQKLAPIPAKKTAAQPATTSTIQEKFLLWCVNSKPLRTRLAHISVDKNTTDMHVFQKLRAEYRRIRGWRAIVSLRDIGMIRFVKFKNYRLDHVGCFPKEEIPKHPHDKDYEPQPLPEFPPVLVEELMEYFETPSCTGTSVETLKALPKKINGRICSDNNIGWGLHAQEHLSAFKVVCSCLLVLIPCTIFIVCWFHFHPGDIQGAFSPPAFIASLYAAVLVVPQLLSSRYI